MFRGFEHYGFDPRIPYGGRLCDAKRWPIILSQLIGRTTIECGHNGRQIPHETGEIESAKREIMDNDEFSDIIIMLGTNGVFCMPLATAEKVAARMENFLKYIKEMFLEKEQNANIILVVPPQIDLRGTEIDIRFTQTVELLGEEYSKVAQRTGVSFINAFLWNVPLSFDGIHISGEGTKIFAERMADELKRI